MSDSPILLRFTYTAPNGEVEHDETVVIDAVPLYGFEKGISVLGGQGTMTVTFDPPLVAQASE